MYLHFLSKRHSVKESGKTVPLPHLPPLPAPWGPVEPWGSCPVTEAGLCRRPTPRPLPAFPEPGQHPSCCTHTGSKRTHTARQAEGPAGRPALAPAALEIARLLVATKVRVMNGLGNTPAAVRTPASWASALQPPP